MKTITKALSLCLALLMIFAIPVGVSAAEIGDNDTIDFSKTGSITIYKYDITSSEKDGVWDDSYVSTGTFDQSVVDTLGGADSSRNTLGNGETSNGYSIKGVEFSYLKIADIAQYTEAAEGSNNHAELLYGIDKETGADFLAAIGLENGKDHYEKSDTSDKLDSSKYYYTSDLLIDGLKAALEANSTAVKNALEIYIAANGGTAMPLTDEFGRTEAKDLPLGLYLCVETKLPHQVVSSCDPFLVSIPMTATNTTDGGSGWIYDITLYPKNITGIPSLEKQLRESKSDTGKNNGSAAITDGYAHTATASNGDVIEYQIISGLPSITSKATYLSDYTFIDTLSKGITYNKSDVVLEFYRDKACTDLVTRWTQGDGKFAASYGTSEQNESTMTIALTEAGLNEVNTAATVYTEASMVNSGYSDCTLRITYAATVNADATVVYGDSGNPNQVVLSWQRSSTNYYDTLVDDCHLYVYGIDLTKQFSDDAGNYANVEFLLHNDTDDYYVTAKLDEATGIYYVTDYTADKAAATRFVPVESGGAAGKIIIKGIEDDSFTATEVKTDNGYTLLRDDIEIVITKEDASGLCDIYSADTLGLIQNDPRYAKAILDEAKEKGYIKTSGGLVDILNNMPQAHLEHHPLTASATVDGNQVNMLADGSSGNALAPLSVRNAKGFTLPKTGDSGVWMYGLVGIVLMVGSIIAFLLIARKNRNSR